MKTTTTALFVCSALSLICLGGCGETLPVTQKDSSIATNPDGSNTNASDGTPTSPDGTPPDGSTTNPDGTVTLPPTSPTPIPPIPKHYCHRKKVAVCHKPPGNIENAHTLYVGMPAVQGHLGHGDTLGQCVPVQ